MKFKNRLSIAMISITILSILFTFFLILMIILPNIIYERENKLKTINQIFIERYDNWLNRQTSIVKIAAETPEIYELFDKQAIRGPQKNISNLLVQNKSIENIVVLNQNTIIYNKVKENFDYKFKDILYKNESNKYYMYIKQKIVVPEEIFKLLPETSILKKDLDVVLKINLSTFSVNFFEEIKKYQMGNLDNSIFFVLNKKDYKLIMNSSSKEKIDTDIIKNNIKKNIIQHDNKLISISISGNYIYGVIFKQEDIYGPIFSFYRIIFTNLIIFGLVALLFSFFMTGRLTKDIGQLVEAASSIAQRNYNVEVPVKSKNEEIRLLSTAFQNMIENISEFTEQLESKVEIRTEELRQEKEKVEKAQLLLSKYVDPQLAKKVIEEDSPITRGNQRKKLTYFFSDIKGFTQITDGMEPEDMAEMLNEYLSEMILIVHKYNGTLAHIIGDALLVLFGAPEETNDKDQALRCVRMAIDMQNKMRDLNKKWYNAGVEEPLKIRCGINTGMANVGSYGPIERLEYTAMGLQVTLAARLQNLCEPDQILLSHSTWALIKEEIETVPIGDIQLKGFHKTIKAYKISPEYFE